MALPAVTSAVVAPVTVGVKPTVQAMLAPAASGVAVGTAGLQVTEAPAGKPEIAQEAEAAGFGPALVQLKLPVTGTPTVMDGGRLMLVACMSAVGATASTARVAGWFRPIRLRLVGPLVKLPVAVGRTSRLTSQKAAPWARSPLDTVTVLPPAAACTVVPGQVVLALPSTTIPAGRLSVNDQPCLRSRSVVLVMVIVSREIWPRLMLAGEKALSSCGVTSMIWALSIDESLPLELVWSLCRTNPTEAPLKSRAPGEVTVCATAVRETAPPMAVVVNGVPPTQASTAVVEMGSSMPASLISEKRSRGWTNPDEQKVATTSVRAVRNLLLELCGILVAVRKAMAPAG